MREILFKGKPTQEALENATSFGDIGLNEITRDGWAYGSLIWNNGIPFIIGDIVDWGDEYISPEWWVAVIPDTVCQFTGITLTDGKKMIKIFEGDILEVNLGYPTVIGGHNQSAVSGKGEPWVALYVVGHEGTSFTMHAVEGSCKGVKLGMHPHIMDALIDDYSTVTYKGNKYDNHNLLGPLQ